MVGGRSRAAREPVVRVLVVVALGVDAVVHLRLAEAQQLAAPGGIGGGALFRVQAVAAITAGVLLLVGGRRWAYLLAAVAALSAFLPALLYTYVQVPTIGPIPSMYDPTWHTAKVVSVVAEGAAVVLAVVGAVLTSGSHARTPGRRPVCAAGHDHGLTQNSFPSGSAMTCQRCGPSNGLIPDGGVRVGCPAVETDRS